MAAVAAIHIQDALGGVEGFFLQRRKRQGGFSATPRLPATIEDTYHALRSLDILSRMGIQVSGGLFEGHSPFLKAKLDEGAFGMENLFRLVWSLRYLGIIDRDEAAMTVWPLVQERITGHLEDLFYLKRLAKLLNGLPGELGEAGPFDAESPVSAHETTGLRRARMYIFLNDRRMDEASRSRWIEWIWACQNGDGGFGFMPWTTSFMENCWYALDVLNLLGSGPEDIQGLVSFILSARSASGGFGRKNLGVPFPETTYQALSCLQVIAEL